MVANAMMERNYTIINGSPPPMRSDDYGDLLTERWQALLAEHPAEEQVQQFLEQHPSMIPGAFGVVGHASGHTPFPGAIITQPELYGYHSRRPDFMWISKNSSFLNPVLIEIEAPDKKLFRKDGSPTAHFTQARAQLSEWKIWFNKPENQQAFMRAYGIPFNHLKLEPQYVLIFGRRAEFEHSDHLTRLRAELMGHNEILMSFDRLSYDPKANQLATARHSTIGYEILHLPPTYWLGPTTCFYEMPLSGRIAAAERNPLISEERKEFLRERIPVWDAWNRGQKGIYSSGDRE